jgi:hypothetical protein
VGSAKVARGGLSLIAALYVETNGVYYGLPDVDPWDEARDARNYAGPWPVVAHPPCARWCALAPLIESLHAERLGDSYRVGNDGGCFAAALRAVRTFGGVLEHPAYSLAWAHFGLPVPGRHGWTRSLWDEGWSTEVSQSAYGHEARKRTWLYFVGDEPPAMRWYEGETTAQVSAFAIDSARARGLKLLDNGKSNPTPPAFQDALLDMARSVDQLTHRPTRSEHSLEGAAVNGLTPVGQEDEP